MRSRWMFFLFALLLRTTEQWKLKLMNCANAQNFKQILERLSQLWGKRMYRYHLKRVVSSLEWSERRETKRTLHFARARIFHFSFASAREFAIRRRMFSYMWIHVCLVSSCISSSLGKLLCCGRHKFSHFGASRSSLVFFSFFLLASKFMELIKKFAGLFVVVVVILLKKVFFIRSQNYVYFICMVRWIGAHTWVGLNLVRGWTKNDLSILNFLRFLALFHSYHSIRIE